MRGLGIALVAFTVLIVIVAFVFFFLAIWTGDQRYTATGFTLFFPAIGSGLAAALSFGSKR